MKKFVSRALVGAAVSGMVLAGAASGASAAGPRDCGAPGREFIAGAAKEAGPNAGPKGFEWGPTRDGVPPVPGQAIIGVCLLGL